VPQSSGEGEHHDLEEEIMGFPLPWKSLLLPRNLLFLLEGAAAALRICVELTFRRIEVLFPAARPVRRQRSVERAAIAFSLTEGLLRSRFFPFRRTCLRRSLLLAHLLRRSGIEVKIALGVDPRGGNFRGHAWLCREGKPFLEPDEEWRRHTAMFYLPIDDGSPGD
jgi:hypothetical protein